MPSTKSAGIVIIGDEILSGRTHDTNFMTIATFLSVRGIEVREGRLVADVEAAIVEAVNTLRARYDYVFTTGGIGPTHDDITADAVAKAFGRPIGLHPDAYRLLLAHYGEERFNEARQRMARTPVGASLIDNPVSVAPGFQIENVFVMAGVPVVAKAMLESLAGRLEGGARVETGVVLAAAPEGDIAAPLGAIQARYAQVAIGSYPGQLRGRFVTRLVARSSDAAALAGAMGEIEAMIAAGGWERLEAPR